MKKSYVRPVMSVEVYTPNSYIAACDEWILNGLLNVTNKDWSWPVITNNGQKTLTWNKQTLYTDHTFVEDEYSTFTGPNGTQHKSWTCTCHDGKYYLEYSDHHTNLDYIGNGNPTFYLHYETTRNNTLTVANYQSNATKPYKDSNSDLLLSRVTYAQGTSPVVNS